MHACVLFNFINLVATVVLSMRRLSGVLAEVGELRHLSLSVEDLSNKLVFGIISGYLMQEFCVNRNGCSSY